MISFGPRSGTVIKTTLLFSHSLYTCNVDCCIKVPNRSATCVAYDAMCVSAWPVYSSVNVCRNAKKFIKLILSKTPSNWPLFTKDNVRTYVKKL